MPPYGEINVAGCLHIFFPAASDAAHAADPPQAQDADLAAKNARDLRRWRSAAKTMNCVDV